METENTVFKGNIGGMVQINDKHTATAIKDKIVAELRLINNRAFIVFSFRVKFKSEKKQCKIRTYDLHRFQCCSTQLS